MTRVSIVASLTARIPEIDWNRGFGRHWHGGNPAATHAFNALSFLFPQGERFFIGVVREIAGTVDLSRNPQLAAAVRGFIAQEASHHQQHARYNAVLQRQGYANVVESWIVRLQAHSERHHCALTKLAIVCGYEHYTAVLGDYILRNPHALAAAEADMALVWGWHGAEETEHKAVCFDLYTAAGGGWLRRALFFLLVTANFNYMFARSYLSLLHRDGCLKPPHLLHTIVQALTFLLGRRGVGWHLLGHGLRYLDPRFHPWRQDNRAQLAAWLAANATRLRRVHAPDESSR